MLHWSSIDMISQERSQFFSIEATYKLTKSKWSTYYKIAKHIFSSKYIENYWSVQCMLLCHTYVSHPVLQNTTQITMYMFCHDLSLLHIVHRKSFFWLSISFSMNSLKMSLYISLLWYCDDRWADEAQFENGIVRKSPPPILSDSNTCLSS